MVDMQGELLWTAASVDVENRNSRDLERGVLGRRDRIAAIDRDHRRVVGAVDRDRYRRRYDPAMTIIDLYRIGQYQALPGGQIVETLVRGRKSPANRSGRAVRGVGQTPQLQP